MQFYKKIHLFFISLLALATLNCFAQKAPIDMSKYKLRHIKSFAQNAERTGDIYTAIDFYEYYLAKKSDNFDVRFQLAEMYRLSNDFVRAQKEYEYIYDFSPNDHTLALYYASLLEMNNGNYDKAKKGFASFMKEYRGKPNDAYFRRLAYFYNRSCDSALIIQKQQNDISVTLLNRTINTPHTEFAPIVLNNNTLLYGSMKLDSIVYFNRVDTLSQIPTRQLYTAENKNNNWTGDKKFDAPFNQIGENITNGAISTDGKRFFFNKCAPNWQNKMICNLYVSHKDSTGNWQDPLFVNFPVNDPNYTTSQPTVGINTKKGNEVIYFVSDREGSKGGMDIWYTEWNDKDQLYTEPKNAGLKINTMGDEITPYYDNTSLTLYFSSNLQPGIGGFDIFKTTGDLKRWTLLENLGLPFNSTFDDIYYTHSPSKEFGFFVSNRPGGYALKNPTCCDDIYYYKWNKFISVSVKGGVYDIPENEAIQLITKKFNIAKGDKKLENEMSGVNVQLFLYDSITKQKFLLSSTTTDSEGNYTFNNLDYGKNYFVYIDNYGYSTKRIDFSTAGIKESDTIRLNTIGINQIPNQPLALSIYYELNQVELNDAAQQTLDTTIVEIMNKIPGIIIELSSHTDTLGLNELNEKISQQRAEKAVDYLIKKGIDQNRLIAKGYGSSQPIEPNFNADGTDNPTGREKNRRTEIKIVGSLYNFYKDEKDLDDIIKEKDKKPELKKIE